MRLRTALAALACCALVAGVALAAKPKVSSTVTLRSFHDGDAFVFKGRVRSDEAKCERNRKVEITAGNFPQRRVVLEGTVTTDDSGRYEHRVKAAGNSIGFYKAIALRKRKPQFVCKRAVSPIDQ